MLEERLNAEKIKYVVHKFGGTSVGNAQCILQVRDIVLTLEEKTHIAVVVSAMGGKPKVTDLLISALQFAKEGNSDASEEVLESLRKKHWTAVEAILPRGTAEDLMKVITQDLSDLSDVFRAVKIMRSYNDRVLELVCGHGELWSARILTAVLNHAGGNFTFVDARKILIVDRDENDGILIDWEESAKRLQSFLMDQTCFGPNLVITGFIASTREGVSTTLKRDGSDYSASIFGRLLKSKSITIWTDVNGVLSADPSRVSEAQCLDHISYQEAMELAYFGAKVIHPKTMFPAILESIPIIIRNSFNANHRGTTIFKKKAMNLQDPTRRVVSGFSTVDHLALFNLEGAGMVGVHGVSSRLFSALDQKKINVVLIAQASSEHSICFAIPSHRAVDAKEAIESAFFREIHVGDVETVDYISPVSVIAAVGDNMSQTPGVCARFFGALGRAFINILAVSQGSSERNISAVVLTSDSARALRAVHSSFFLSDQTISVGILLGIEEEGEESKKKKQDLSNAVAVAGSAVAAVAGSAVAAVAGGVFDTVGGALLNQVYSQATWLKDRYNVDIRIRAIANDQKMMLHPTGWQLNTWQKDFEDAKKTKALDLQQLGEHIQTDQMPHWLIVDLSHSQNVLEMYETWLGQRTHLVSANSAASWCPLHVYQGIHAKKCQNASLLDLECSMGIGLPILKTMQDLLQTGDHIVKMEGELTSVMGMVLSQLLMAKHAATTEKKKNEMDDEPTLKMNEEKLLSFSEMVRQVLMGKDKKVSHMTPRDLLEDLSGLSSAKKALVIARELGLELELADVQISNLIKVTDPNMDKWSMAQTLTFLESFDSDMAKLTESCRQEGTKLKLVSRIDAHGRVDVSLRVMSNTDSLYHLNGSSVAVAFYTSRYGDEPLIVQGPSPSISIQASSVFGSILTFARSVGARDTGAFSSTNPQVVRISPSQSFEPLIKPC